MCLFTLFQLLNLYNWHVELLIMCRLAKDAVTLYLIVKLYCP